MLRSTNRSVDHLGGTDLLNVKVRFRASIALMMSALFLAPAAYGQTYPAKPVRLIVAFPPGGGTDTVSRLISKKLAEAWPQPIVVENRPGGDGVVATELIAKAAPDGYTLVMVTNAHTVTPFQRRLAYDPVKDVAPVSLVASIPNLLLVHPSLPVKSVKDLITLAKARPGQLNFGSSGAGTTPYLAMELLKSMAGIDMVNIPYKGSALSVIDLLGGHIQLVFSAVSAALPHVKTNKLRAVAISSARRWALLPDIPTVAETLRGFEASSWYGVIAPPGTPPAIINKLQADIAAAVNSPDSKKYLEDLGFISIASTPDEFGAVIRTDMKKWGAVMSKLGTQAVQ